MAKQQETDGDRDDGNAADCNRHASDCFGEFRRNDGLLWPNCPKEMRVVSLVQFEAFTSPHRLDPIPGLGRQYNFGTVGDRCLQF